MLLDCKSIFTENLPIKGIGKMHFFSIINGKSIGSIVTKNDAPNIACQEDDYMTGEWVLVEYDGKFYPGEVISKINDSYSVNVMIPAGKNWKWPKNPDKFFYKKENIVKKLSFPSLVNSRNHFFFDKI